MKTYLMYKNQDFDLQIKLPSNEQALTEDLELTVLFDAMSLGDKFLFEASKKAILSSLSDIETIKYRQDILKDCLKNPLKVREIYDIAIQAIEGVKKIYFGFFSKYPDAILSGSIERLKLFMRLLKDLRKISESADKFDSEGFIRFFSMINKELDDEYFLKIQNHLKELKFGSGVLISAQLGKGNKGINYILRKSQYKKQSWIERIFDRKSSVYSFTISDRDESGAKAISELRDRGINLVANALAQSSDNILSFFNTLRIELAFYIGCLNLHEQLSQMKGAISFPVPVNSSKRCHSFKGLYDPSLSLNILHKAVDNDLNALNKNIVIITGANQGGKTTFLRSIGLAQLMMQCGMFVPAESFSSNLCESLFTHFKREEDVSMKSGKLDEELSRMSNIVDHIIPNSMLLFNESFSATNEREGSEIARQIVEALLEKRIKIFFVTHLYEFAHNFFNDQAENALFARAERKADGKRSFKIIESKPLQTSYGKDLYDKIFDT